MSTELQSVNTERNGEVSMTQFGGGHKDGVCLQLTARTPDTSGQSDMFQMMQLTKKDAVAMATALMEWAAGQRDENPDF